MSVSQADLGPYQGDDYTATVSVTLSDGSAADLTGYTAAAQIRRGVADADPEVVEEFTCVVSSPLVVITLTHDQTAGLSGQYVWDLELTSATGAITTIVRGKVVMTAEVTRPIAAAKIQAVVPAAVLQAIA
jgi:hypothetical protein